MVIFTLSTKNYTADIAFLFPKAHRKSHFLADNKIAPSKWCIFTYVYYCLHLAKMLTENRTKGETKQLRSEACCVLFSKTTVQALGLLVSFN